MCVSDRRSTALEALSKHPVSGTNHMHPFRILNPVLPLLLPCPPSTADAVPGWTPPGHRVGSAPAAGSVSALPLSSFPPACPYHPPSSCHHPLHRSLNEVHSLLSRHGVGRLRVSDLPETDSAVVATLVTSLQACPLLLPLSSCPPFPSVVVLLSFPSDVSEAHPAASPRGSGHVCGVGHAARRCTGC